MTDAERETAIDVRLATMAEKLDAIHLSLRGDISEVKGQVGLQDRRVGKTELRLAQLQGAGVILTLALPFAAIGLQKLVGG
jgi:hypothetical protein